MLRLIKSKFSKNKKGIFTVCIFGSNRSPRRGNIVCAFVRASVTLFQRTLKMSSIELKQASKQVSTRKAFSRSHALKGLVSSEDRKYVPNVCCQWSRKRETVSRYYLFNLNIFFWMKLSHMNLSQPSLSHQLSIHMTFVRFFLKGA